MPFSHLKSKSSYLLANPEYCQTREGLIDLMCRDCEFWKEEEDNYECGAFKLIRLLLEKNAVSVEEIVRAVSE